MRRISDLLPQGDVARARFVAMLPSVVILFGMIPQVLMGDTARGPAPRCSRPA